MLCYVIREKCLRTGSLAAGCAAVGRTGPQSASAKTLDLPMSVNNKQMCVSLGHASQQQKLLSSP